MLEEFTDPENEQPTSYPKPTKNGKPRPPDPTPSRERVVHNTPTDEDIESWGVKIRKG